VERDELARRGGSGRAFLAALGPRGIAAGRGAKRLGGAKPTGGAGQARKAAGLGAAVPGRGGALVVSVADKGLEQTPSLLNRVGGRVLSRLRCELEVVEQTRDGASSRSTQLTTIAPPYGS
jgi:hypothetical protein